MEQPWRITLKEYIENHYITGQDEWFDIVVSTAGKLNILIVSRQFVGTAAPQRREELQQLLQRLQVPLLSGLISLYTPEEATLLELPRPPARASHDVYTWFDLATQAANRQEIQQPHIHEPHIPATIVFYSFKGGVGRTTALIQTAMILARRGRKIVVVDLDLEAPGLSSALGLAEQEHGITDFFYERSYLPTGVEPTIAVAEIFTEVRLTNASGRLFVVPAGKLDLDYIAKVDDLRANVLTERGENLWSTFYRELTEQLQPDIILVDSRTGLNEWGAFSLLRVADKAIIFLYPNEQNRHGVSLITDALAGILSAYFVFSPVPAAGDLGMELVRKQWNILQPTHNDAEGDEEAQNEFAEPIVIPYLTGIALADNYPVEELAPYYMRIANVIEEDTNADRVQTVLADTNSRWTIIESLKFPEVDAKQNQNFEDLFQRTADFDKFLDGTTCLIRGRKGTGKTALYTLLLKHKEEAKRLSRKRLEAVTCLSGHGSFYRRPEKDEFQLIGHSIEQQGGSWEAFWRAYLFLRVHWENLLPKLLKGAKDLKYRALHNAFNAIPKGIDGWKIEYTHILIRITTDTELNLLMKDALDDINIQLEKNREVLWFLYDDLDVDFREENELRNKALSGLFQLVQACDARQLKSIGFKLFLREDIWRRLIFDNKSHFNGRDIMLKWTRLDFLKLALRQAQQSQAFKDLIDNFSPVENIDQADEESIDQALQPLWGSRREKNPKSKYVSRWVYERLTDSSDTTFPRSLSILLRAAKDYELSTRDQQAPPNDRLLRQKSLIEGLVTASEYRCEELRNEYTELTPFFDSLVGLNLLISRSALQQVWQKTVQTRLAEFKDFKKFIDFLLNIGLIGLAEHRGKEQGYRFAEIYTHGFKIYRGTRKY